MSIFVCTCLHSSSDSSVFNRTDRGTSILIWRGKSWLLSYTAEEPISFLSKCSEKIFFPKKLHWNMIFLVLSRKMVFLFPEKDKTFLKLWVKNLWVKSSEERDHLFWESFLSSSVIKVVLTKEVALVMQTNNIIRDNFKHKRHWRHWSLSNEGPIWNFNKILYRQSLTFCAHFEKSMVFKTMKK